MKPTVEAKNLCFNYHSLDGETEALKDLSFTVEKGEFISIVGPSGCGNARHIEIQQNGELCSPFCVKNLLNAPLSLI